MTRLSLRPYASATAPVQVGRQAADVHPARRFGPAGNPSLRVPEYRVVILGAGPGSRGDLPPALFPVGNGGRLLDWLLAAFRHLPDVEVDFVSGFMADEITGQYRTVQFHHNPDWSETGPARSLSMAPLSSVKSTFVCYSDVVFRPDTVQRMQDEEVDLVVAVDSKWAVRYEGRSRSELEDAEKIQTAGGLLTGIGKQIDVRQAHGEFAGLVKLSSQIANRLQNVLGSTAFNDRDGLPEVISFLLDHGTEAPVVDVDGEWAELNAPQDLAHFVLGTKAESLERLSPLVKSGTVGKLLRCTYHEWTTDPDGVLSRIQAQFPDEEVITRSSSLSEDGWDQSSAGAYKSIPHVPTGDRNQLASAIGDVFESYGSQRPDNQILVQKMLAGVRMSGVVMTRTHGHGAPYFVINYDDSTARTDTVTSGEGGHVKTLYLHRGAPLDTAANPDHVRLLDAVGELERLVGHDSLDIEFAVTANDAVQILQVRPIAATRDYVSTNDATIKTAVCSAQRCFEDLQTPPPFVLGRFTQLSVMTDWNPAEIIGTKPALLALSVYRYIITDETWARARAEYGYRDTRPCNLIVDILGHPYVDVRACFNSFIPAVLDDDLATRLVEHHLHHLATHPELHDKVEFDILFTCWTFDIDDQLQRLRKAGFQSAAVAELKSALLDITRQGIRRCQSDHDSLDEVNRRYERIRASTVAPLAKAYLHLENARQSGALIFCHLARGAFVATSLLRSMVKKGILTVEQSESLLGSLRTVSTAMQDDARRVSAGDLAWDEFVQSYGHLRPGTYDINSSRYGDAPDEFLGPIVGQTGPETVDAHHTVEPDWDDDAVARVEAELSRSGLETSTAEFLDFLRVAIEGREYGKFIFTRDVSAALECVAEFGAAYFVSRKELAHIDIHDLLKFRSPDVENPSVALRQLAEDGTGAYRVHQSICLPDQILSADDIACFEYRKVTPNYVTRKSVRAPVVSLSPTSNPGIDLDGKIVVIPNADPGFDWIFSRHIAGLVTKYGGTNSHMAVRMAEFQLPGVTGVGELLFEKLLKATVVELDCAGRHIRIVQP